MSLEVKQQISNLINQSSSILIPLPQQGSDVACGNALALYYVCQAMSKEVYLYAPSDFDPAKYDFLDTSMIQHELSGPREAIISIDTTEVPIDQMRYETDENALNIYVTPRSGVLDSEYVSVQGGKYEFDLILTVNTPHLSSLGTLFYENPDLFYETPTVSIGNSPAHDMYGQINLVDVGSVSVAEIVFDLLKTEAQYAIDEPVATALLFSLIQETDNFQSHTTGPRTFMDASELMERGARREEIIRVLYKTKSVSLVKLVGRIMAHISFSRVLTNPEAGRDTLVYSKLFAHDFEKTRTSAADLPAALAELSNHLAMNTAAVHIMYDLGETTKRGLIVFRCGTPLERLHTVLDGEVQGGIFFYSYATESDIHTACDEVNASIEEVLQK